MCSLYPSHEDLPGLEDTGIDAYLEQLAREVNPVMWTGLVAGSLLFEATPVMTTGVPLPAFLLPKPLLDRHAQRIASSNVYPVRQAVFLVKMFAGFCWAKSAEVRDHLGMAPFPNDPGTYQTGEPRSVRRRRPAGANSGVVDLDAVRRKRRTA